MKTSDKYQKNFSTIVTKALSIALLMFLNADTFGQDTLVMKGNSKIAAKVIEISNTEIKYKMFDNSNGPDCVASTSSVSQIKYTNGTIDTFNTVTVSNVDQSSELKEMEGPNMCDDRSVRGPEMQETLSVLNNVYICNPVRAVTRNNGFQCLGVAVASFLTEVGYNCTVSLLR